MDPICQTVAESSTTDSAMEEERSTDPACQSEMNSNSTFMSVKAWVILDEITRKSGSKNLDELVVKDIIPAIRRHKSVELNCTPRLVDEITVYASGLLSEFKTAKSAGGQNARRFKAKINEQTWRCEVIADEFVTKKDFERIVKEEADYQDEMQETKEEKDDNGKPSVTDEIALNTTFLLLSGELLLDNVKIYKDTCKTKADIALDVLNATCQSKSVQIKHSEELLAKVTKRFAHTLANLKRVRARDHCKLWKARSKLMEKTYKVKVHASDFVRMDDFRRICMEWEQHELETKTNKKTMEFEDLEDEDNVSAKDWPELVTGMCYVM